MPTYVMKWQVHQSKVSTMSTGAVRFSLVNSHHSHQRLGSYSILFSRPCFETSPIATVAASPSSPSGCSHCCCAAALLMETSRSSQLRQTLLGTRPTQPTRTGRLSHTQSCASASGDKHSSVYAGTSDHTWNT